MAGSRGSATNGVTKRKFARSPCRLFAASADRGPSAGAGERPAAVDADRRTLAHWRLGVDDSLGSRDRSRRTHRRPPTTPDSRRSRQPTVPTSVPLSCAPPRYARTVGKRQAVVELRDAEVVLSDVHADLDRRRVAQVTRVERARVVGAVDAAVGQRERLLVRRAVVARMEDEVVLIGVDEARDARAPPLGDHAPRPAAVTRAEPVHAGGPDRVGVGRIDGERRARTSPSGCTSWRSPCAVGRTTPRSGWSGSTCGA